MLSRHNRSHVFALHLVPLLCQSFICVPRSAPRVLKASRAAVESNGSQIPVVLVGSRELGCLSSKDLKSYTFCCRGLVLSIVFSERPQALQIREDRLSQWLWCKAERQLAIAADSQSFWLRHIVTPSRRQIIRDISVRTLDPLSAKRNRLVFTGLMIRFEGQGLE